MKPLKLTMQAFGPFAGREQVDFSELPSDALFLIHGPTGAGKTTLLDGICYALYGSTSGGERLPREMRSHHAPDDVPTEVELEFELGGKRFRVKRVPDQERPALRGNRKTKVAAGAELYRHDGGDWVSLASRSGEVTARVESLLGFEAEQFRQVIMLPQGQFRKLLSAGTSERERIMETLFATEKYRRLQDRLQESARALERQAEEESRKRETLLGQAGLESEQALQDHVTALGLALQQMEPELAQARIAAAAAADAVTAGELLGGKFAELEQAGQALQRMLQDDEAMSEQRRRLAGAQVARQVEPSWEMLQAAIRQHEDARTKAAKASSEATAAEKLLAGADERLKTEARREDEREGARRRLTLLEDHRTKVSLLEDAKQKAEQAAAALASAGKLLERHESEAARLAARRQSLKAENERLQPLAGRATAAKLEADLQESSLRLAVEVENTRLALEKTNAAYLESARKLEAAQTAVTAARRKRDRLLEAWRMGQAAVLAHHLHDGESCPVCGSREHPNPARQGADVPDDDTLKAVADELETVEAACDRLRTSHSAAELARGQHASKLATLRDTLAAHEEGVPATSIAERRDRLAALREEAKSAADAAAKLEQASQQMKACEAAIETNTKALDHARTATSQAQSAVQAATAGHDAVALQLPETVRSRAALEQAIGQAGAEVQAIENAFKSAQQAFESASVAAAGVSARSQAANEALATAAARKDEAERALAGALSQAGFADGAAFLAARMSPETTQAAERQIREHDESLAAARERATRAEEAVRGMQAADLPSLKEASMKANAALEEILGRQGVMLQQRRDLGRTGDLLAESRARRDAVEKEYAVLGELAAVAAGRNDANMAFQRYVLAALLDDVLRQASLRLKAMSRNRYALQRSGGVADGRRAAGLDLEVLDDYTGRTRPASTLSGGEGFMASLALALGLSDTVQAYAGGVKLDTLFIDEGFGTLDPEALDSAMKALIDLQQRGRMVGIISHVEELKRQIEHGIEIRYAAGGSTLRVGNAASRNA